MLVFGNQESHIELRVRLVIEMVIHFKLYLSPEFLSKGSCDDGHDILLKLKRYSEIHSVSQCASKALQEEILCIRKQSKECGMWHLFAAANILGSAVTSVFPDKGGNDMRHLTKRTILPTGDQLNTATFVMWTSHRDDLMDEHWVPNHFVPLLPLHPRSDEPSVVVEEDMSDTTLNTGFLFER